MPSGCLVSVALTGSPASLVPSTTTVSPSLASFGKPTSTEPSSLLGVSVGALGAVLSELSGAVAGVLSEVLLSASVASAVIFHHWLTAYQV